MTPPSASDWFGGPILADDDDRFEPEMGDDLTGDEVKPENVIEQVGPASESELLDRLPADQEKQFATKFAQSALNDARSRNRLRNFVGYILTTVFVLVVVGSQVAFYRWALANRWDFGADVWTGYAAITIAEVGAIYRIVVKHLFPSGGE